MAITRAFSIVGALARNTPRQVRRAEHPSAQQAPGSRKAGRAVAAAARFKLDLLDFVVALARKVGGFCALLTLGWIYFRELALGQSLQEIFPGAADPDLRQTMWVALFLIMAQGWDIPVDEIAVYVSRLRTRFPQAASARRAAREPLLRPAAAWRMIEPVVTRLGRFMDLCVAIANKVGALAVMIFLCVLAKQLWWDGMSLRQMYPTATDPMVSLLADLCVYVVVLGWWAMPMEQVRIFWHRLKEVGGR